MSLGAELMAAPPPPMHGQDRASGAASERRCFTILVGTQTFGVPVENIQTVFEVSAVTPVPLAPADVVGLVNLRGKIVTAVSLRRRLGLPDAPAGTAVIAVGLDFRDESFALVVDEVGDVITLDDESQIETPPHLGLEANTLASVHCLDGLILPILNLSWIFSFSRKG